MRDPYEVLGVSRSASADEIKSAFRRLAREHHPDVNQGDPQAEEKFKEIGQAYAILSDPEKKARFDQFGTAEEIPMGGGHFTGDLGDIFSMFFGNMGGNGRRNMGRDGDDLRVDVSIQLVDVIAGTKKSVTYKKESKCSDCSGKGTKGGVEPDVCSQCKGSGQVSRVQNTFLGQVRTATTCSQCRGAGTIIKSPCENCKGRGLKVVQVELDVDIPAGIESGTTIQVPGKGSDGIGLGSTGDLFVVVQVQADEKFERHGKDVVCPIEITFAQAALGDEVSVEGIDQDYDIEIPKGTQPGEFLRVEGAGLPPLHGNRRGDLIYQVQVKIPEKLNDEQKAHIRKLAELLGEDVPTGQEGGGIIGGLFRKKK